MLFQSGKNIFQVEKIQYLRPSIFLKFNIKKTNNLNLKYDTISKH